MAKALVNVLLERLATLALDKVEEEFRLFIGVEKEIASLTSNLDAIQAVLEDAERRQMTEATVKRWLSKLIEVSLDIDDVLDDWITQFLRHQLEKREKHALGITKKVRSSASSFIHGSKLRRLSHRRGIAGRIRELNGRIDMIAKQKQDFSFQNIIARVPQLPQRPKTTSLPNFKTLGRDNEKNLIISKLLSESSEGNEVPLIIPIVGMGGMGKTSLANLVYNDDRVRSHFDKRVWVCVSNPFEEIKIAQAIIGGLDRDNTSKNSNELQILVQCIYELLEGKKILLVLDDVWSPQHNQWEELINPLRNGAMGCTVLVTTRNVEVVGLMKATTQMIRMKELDDSFCLSLFYHSAGMEENNVPEELEDIGLEIVKKCKGLPLAVKSLGSLMHNKKTVHDWRAILDSKIWELKEIEQKVFQPLLLSYHDLDPAVKHCLLYCVLFPKDYIYNKISLIEGWMSQDYLNVKRGEEIEIIGQNYFDDLVKRSFFQDIEVGDQNGDTTCKIHDIVHEFLQFLTKNTYLFLDSGERKHVPNDTLYHLGIEEVAIGGDILATCALKCKRIRSFIIADLSPHSVNNYDSLLESIVQLKGLRTLHVCYNGSSSVDPPINFEIPEMIGELIHLRYLDLSGHNIKKLPSAMGRLYNLQTLRLVGCRVLEKIDVRMLINLRHLYVGGCPRLDLIEGVGNLTDLQTLDNLRVENGGDEANKLEDLKDLNKLRSLSIVIKGDAIMGEKGSIMVKKARLLRLKLHFIFSQERPREVMDGLEPHPALESLNIMEYGGGAFSNWLSSLHCLRVLNLVWCHCEFLPPLGKLASLESLHIENLNGVEKVGVEFLGITSSSSSSIFTSFPKLREFSIDSMGSWQEWEDENPVNIKIMPCLSHLTIKKCRKLEALPEFLWKTPLQNVHIWNSPILQALYEQENGGSRPRILTSLASR